MLAFYLTIAILVCMVAYAGVESTMQLFAFVDLEIRWHIVLFRTFFIRRKLEKELGFPKTSFLHHFKTYGK